MEDDAEFEDRDADALRDGAVLDVAIVLLRLLPLAVLMTAMRMSTVRVLVFMPMLLRRNLDVVSVLQRSRRFEIRSLRSASPSRAPDGHDRFHGRDRRLVRQSRARSQRRRVRAVPRVPNVVPSDVVRVVVPEPALLEETGAGARRDQLDEEYAEDSDHGDGGRPVVRLPCATEAVGPECIERWCQELQGVLVSTLLGALGYALCASWCSHE